MPEWSIGAVSKTVIPFGYPGFESLSFRKQEVLSHKKELLAFLFAHPLPQAKIKKQPRQVMLCRDRLKWLRGNLVGISVNLSQSEEEELFVHDSSERASKSFDFCIERLGCCVRSPVDIEV